MPRVESIVAGRGQEPLAASEGITFRGHRGQVVGYLSRDGWLTKRVSYEKHHLHRFGAWATEAGHLAELKAHGGVGIRLYLDDGRCLESRVEAWDKYGFRPAALSSEQIALGDAHWTVHQPGTRQMAMSL